MVELIFLGLVDIITKFLKYLWILNIENIFYTRNLTNFSMEIGFESSIHVSYELENCSDFK
jgi:hypothetical protein